MHCIAELTVEMFIKQQNEQTIHEQIQKKKHHFIYGCGLKMCLWLVPPGGGAVCWLMQTFLVVKPVS